MATAYDVHAFTCKLCTCSHTCTTEQSCMISMHALFRPAARRGWSCIYGPDRHDAYVCMHLCSAVHAFCTCQGRGSDRGPPRRRPAGQPTDRAPSGRAPAHACMHDHPARTHTNASVVCSVHRSFISSFGLCLVHLKA